MNKRILTVSYYSNYNCKETSFIRLQGKWLEDTGFKIGDKIEVRKKPEERVIRVVKSSEEVNDNTYRQSHKYSRYQGNFILCFF